MNDGRLWSPLVLSRTYQADYRFIVMPEDIAALIEKKNELKGVISKIIHASPPNKGYWPLAAKERPKWLLIKDNQHCIVGVVSKAEDLLTKQYKLKLVKNYLSAESRSVQEITKDIHGRDIYVFTGYVSRGITTRSELPHINLNVFQFERLYSYVCEAWLENQYTANIKNVVQPYKFQTDVFDVNENYYMPTKLSINTKLNTVAMWPDGDDYRIQVWALSLKYIGNISTCLGIDEKTATEISFRNVTATNVKDPKIVEQVKESSQKYLANPELKAAEIVADGGFEEETSTTTGTFASTNSHLPNGKSNVQMTTQPLIDVANEKTKLSTDFDVESQAIKLNSLDSKELNLNVTIDKDKPSILIPGIIIFGGEVKDGLTISISIKIKTDTNPEK